jgi:hypothetical protein
MKVNLLMLFRNIIVFHSVNKKRNKCTVSKMNGFDIKASDLEIIGL